MKILSVFLLTVVTVLVLTFSAYADESITTTIEFTTEQIITTVPETTTGDATTTVQVITTTPEDITSTEITTLPVTTSTSEILVQETNDRLEFIQAVLFTMLLFIIFAFIIYMFMSLFDRIF